MGDNLTVVYSSENEPIRKKTKRPAALLPLLVILFIVSYGILTMLVFEQGQTIESQRGLIREMLKDSTQLASMKDKLSRDDAGSQAGGQQDDKASVQADGSAVKAGAPEAAAKGSNVKGSDKAKKSGKSARSMKQIPGRPEADLQDVRRSTRVI